MSKLNNITNICQKYNTTLEHCNAAIEHCDDPTDEDINILQHFNLELARAIIYDLDSNSAESIAKIILGFYGYCVEKPKR